LGLVAQFKSPTKHDGIIHPFPPKLSLFSKDLIGNIEAQSKYESRLNALALGITHGKDWR